jgi:hypothetical protein
LGLEFGVWSLEFGVWSLEFGVWGGKSNSIVVPENDQTDICWHNGKLIADCFVYCL